MPKTRKECLALDRYSMMEDDWTVENEDVFVSPLVGERPGQTVLLGERIRNGSISADAWRKDWIVLAQSSEGMTFDVRHIRSIRYTSTMGADKKVAKDLGDALTGLG